MLSVQQIADAVVDPMMATPVLTQLTFSSLVVWVIDALKASDKFPWLNDKTQKLNKLAAVLGAMLTGAGLHLAIQHSSNGSYSVTMTGFSIALVTHVLASLVSQQTILKAYQAVNILREIAAVAKTK